MAQAQTFAEGLYKAHQALLADLRQLEAAAGAPKDVGPVELAGKLETSRRHLAEHFRFEEQNGYLSVVLQRQPNLERAVQQLHDEHHQLARSLDGLLAEVKKAQTLEDALRQKVREWVREVKRHEEREDTLVQDAFNLDIGAED